MITNSFEELRLQASYNQQWIIRKLFLHVWSGHSLSQEQASGMDWTKYGYYEYTTINSVERKGLLWKAVCLFWFDANQVAARLTPTGARSMHAVCTSFVVLSSWNTKAFIGLNRTIW